MKIRPRRARVNAPLLPQIDPVVIGWLSRRYRLRLPIALIIAAECGLGSRQ
jgi:hypothetical protein